MKLKNEESEISLILEIFFELFLFLAAVVAVAIGVFYAASWLLEVL